MTHDRTPKKIGATGSGFGPRGIQHVITVTYVNTDGTVSGGRYRIEDPLPGSGEGQRTNLLEEE